MCKLLGVNTVVLRIFFGLNERRYYDCPLRDSKTRKVIIFIIRSKQEKRVDMKLKS